MTIWIRCWWPRMWRKIVSNYKMTNWKLYESLKSNTSTTRAVRCTNWPRDSNSKSNRDILSSCQIRPPWETCARYMIKLNLKRSLIWKMGCCSRWNYKVEKCSSCTRTIWARRIAMSSQMRPRVDKISRSWWMGHTIARKSSKQQCLRMMSKRKMRYFKSHLYFQIKLLWTYKQLHQARAERRSHHSAQSTCPPPINTNSCSRTRCNWNQMISSLTRASIWTSLSWKINNNKENISTRIWMNQATKWWTKWMQEVRTYQPWIRYW